jgi:hypothetical protein
MVIAVATEGLAAGGVLTQPATISSVARKKLKANAWENNREYDDGMHFFFIEQFFLCNLSLRL